MRRPFADGGAVFACGIAIHAPAPPVPLTVPSEFAMLRIVQGAVRPYLHKAVRLRRFKERRRP